jgi:hypothetical protein
MNKLLVVSLPIALFLISCAPQQPIPAECVHVNSRDQCSNAPSININRNSHDANPPNYCADAGEDIEVRVTPANGPIGTVRTIPKSDDPDHDWLNGTNNPGPNGFTLTAPDDASGEYRFYVVFSDGYCLDPRITI